MLHNADHPLERGTYLGGYDASAIAWVNPYDTPLSLYARLRGLTSSRVETNIAMELGTYLEPWLLNKAQASLEAETGKTVRITDQQGICIHDQYPFIAGHVDGIAYVGDENEPILIDAKTTSVYSRKNWDEGEIPAVAMFQIYHYFACLPQIKTAYLVVLIGNTDLRMVRVDRNDAIVDQLVTMEVAFWNDHVLAENPPSMEMITGNDLDVIKSMYPESKDETELDLSDDDEVILAAKELVEINARIKELETAKDMYQARLEYALGDHAGANAGAYAFSWKSQSRTSVSTKTLKERYPDIHKELSETSTSRVFRIKEVQPKKEK